MNFCATVKTAASKLMQVLWKQHRCNLGSSTIHETKELEPQSECLQSSPTLCCLSMNGRSLKDWKFIRPGMRQHTWPPLGPQSPTRPSCSWRWGWLTAPPVAPRSSCWLAATTLGPDCRTICVRHERQSNHCHMLTLCGCTWTRQAKALGGSSRVKPDRER